MCNSYRNFVQFQKYWTRKSRKENKCETHFYFLLHTAFIQISYSRKGFSSFNNKSDIRGAYDWQQISSSKGLWCWLLLRLRRSDISIIFLMARFSFLDRFFGEILKFSEFCVYIILRSHALVHFLFFLKKLHWPLHF